MTKTKKLTFLALMLAMVSVLSYIEHTIPPLPFLPPTIKLGLSNVVIMFCVYFVGVRESVLLTVLKSTFVLITRGVTAGIMSFSGGILSVTVLILLIFIFKEKLSYILASVFSSIAHNIGQLTALTIIMGQNMFIYYLPMLLIFGVIMGIITGVVLKVILPVLRKHYTI